MLSPPDDFIASVSGILQNWCDDEIYDYVKHYMQRTKEAEMESFLDFILPLLVPNDLLQDDHDSIEQEEIERVEKIRSLCIEYYEKNMAPVSPITAGKQLKKLENAITLGDQDMSSDATILPKATVDISLSSTSSRFFVSRVNKEKLKKAEARLEKKKNKSGAAQQEQKEGEFVEIKKPQEEEIDLDDILYGQEKVQRDILLRDVDLSFAGKSILSNASLTMAYGRRYGLIGLNGVGKSTFLRALARKELKGVSKGLSILHVEQEVQGDDRSVIQTVVDSDIVRIKLMEREKELIAEGKQDSDEIKKIYQYMEANDSDKVVSNASKILFGLGFNQEEMQRPTKSFSGGWKMRIALAIALFRKPDVLLLDEPTNHLDITSVIWLQEYLKGPLFKGTVVIVSHDREFLDEICTDVMHMWNSSSSTPSQQQQQQHTGASSKSFASVATSSGAGGTIDQYRGNYTLFLSSRQERRRNEQKEYESQLMYRQHLQAFVDRWRFDSKRASQAQSKLKILEKLPPLKPLDDDGIDEALNFKWPDPVDKLSPPILQASELVFSYGDKKILDGVNFDVQLTSRIAIVGPNGAGKSTLLKLLIGELQPVKGQIFRNARLRVAFFSQHHLDSFGPDASMNDTPIELLRKRYPGFSEEEYRRNLGRFGITGTTGTQMIKTLSGGQKSRVVFAMMAMSNPHILVLDEVSNHLDIMTVDSLTRALSLPSLVPEENKKDIGFKGGVVVVSHDTRFIDRVCNELWVCEGGKVSKFMAKEQVLGSGEDGRVAGVSGITEYKKRILKTIQA